MYLYIRTHIANTNQLKIFVYVVEYQLKKLSCPFEDFENRRKIIQVFISKSQINLTKSNQNIFFRLTETLIFQLSFNEHVLSNLKFYQQVSSSSTQM